MAPHMPFVRLIGLALVMAAGAAMQVATQSSPAPIAITYGQQVDVPMPAAFHVFAARLHDWDGDGRPDVLAAPATGSAIYLLRNLSAGGAPRFSFPFADPPIAGQARGRWTLFDAIDEVQQTVASGAHASGVADAIGRTFDIGDIDGDGTPDLLVSRAGRLAWLRNEASPAAPRWSDPDDVRGDDGAPVRFLDMWHTVNPEAVDWDGDGRLDIIAGVWHPSRYVDGDLRELRERGAYSSHSGHLYLLRNVGSAREPRYAPPVALAADTGAMSGLGIPLSRSVDWDGDGDLDLMVAWYDASVRYYENTGSRTSPRLVDRGLLQAAGQPIASAEIFRPDPDVADLDGDGDLDLVLAGHGRAVFWYENVGTSTRPELAAGRPLLVEAGPGTPLHLGNIITPTRFDVDGDGRRDILAGIEPGMFMWARNVGSDAVPAFAAAEALLTVDDRPVELFAKDLGLSMWGQLEDWDERTSPAPVDWDGDGLWDIITNTMSGRVYWLRNGGTTGRPRFEPPRPVETHAGPLQSVPRSRPGVADWTGDGTPDVILPDARGVLVIHPGRRGPDGIIRLSAPIVPRTTGGDAIVVEPHLQHVSAGRIQHDVADWNGDGRLDILLSRRTETTPRRFTVDAYRNVGTAEAPILSRVEVLNDVRSGHEAGLHVTDWDGDDTLDLLTGDQEGRVWFWNGKALPR
jgi:hypothetical protein